MKVNLLFTILFMLIGCRATEMSATPSPAAPTLNGTPHIIILDQPFELVEGQSAEFPPITLTLLGVRDDSRCPADVECFWAGEATVEIDAGNFGIIELVIGGYDNADARAHVTLGNNRLSLEALAPQPHSERTIDRYVATLRLSTVELNADESRHTNGDQDEIAYGFVVTHRPKDVGQLLSR